ncbi:MAG: hypothetical protein DCF19_04890 [Pseudanabaena frigida]|uniref:Uncharacterized protein n=1 Tax=Pseudanabaena frigida TaxID=945775 RepID=A0A2W4WFG9_9CYAN|nr:MAG: hypothetical protein DCF19_04890 [Pseudanabaena frigida]
MFQKFCVKQTLKCSLGKLFSNFAHYIATSIVIIYSCRQMSNLLNWVAALCTATQFNGFAKITDKNMDVYNCWIYSALRPNSNHKKVFESFAKLSKTFL